MQSFGKDIVRTSQVNNTANPPFFLPGLCLLLQNKATCFLLHLAACNIGAIVFQHVISLTFFFCFPPFHHKLFLFLRWQFRQSVCKPIWYNFPKHRRHYPITSPLPIANSRLLLHSIAWAPTHIFTSFLSYYSPFLRLHWDYLCESLHV